MNIATLRRTYAAAKAAYLRELGFDVPERYRSAFVSWGGSVEVQYIVGRFAATLPPGARVLIVGVLGGRDYFFFKNSGFEVTALDIGPQPDIAPITVANVERPLPFPDGTFDAVVISEVLEHLRDDVGALENIHRILKTDGLLMVSVPFFHDREQGHMRIHSPESAKRLLQMGGFVVRDYVERPPLVSPHFLNTVQHAVSLLVYLATVRTAYRWLTLTIGELSWRLGRQMRFRPIRKLSGRFGGYYLCLKGDRLDHINLNRRLYAAGVAVRSIGDAGRAGR